MKFTTEAEERIEKALIEKKKANPVNGRCKIVGIGVELGYSSLSESHCAVRNGVVVCTLDELSRMIEELTMLKDSIEDVTGVVL